MAIGVGGVPELMRATHRSLRGLFGLGLVSAPEDHCCQQVAGSVDRIHRVSRSALGCPGRSHKLQTAEPNGVAVGSTVWSVGS